MDIKLVNQLKEEDLFPNADEKELDRRVSSVNWAREIPHVYNALKEQYLNKLTARQFNDAVFVAIKEGETSRKDVIRMNEQLQELEYRVIMTFEQFVRDEGE
jgi:HD superfamily phosphohydrolase YqeK